MSLRGPHIPFIPMTNAAYTARMNSDSDPAKPRNLGTADWLRFALASVLPVLAGHSLYRFHVEGMHWVGPLGFLCLTLAIFCTQLGLMVRGTQLKRGLLLLHWVLLIGAFVALGVDFLQ